MSNIHHHQHPHICSAALSHDCSDHPCCVCVRLLGLIPHCQWFSAGRLFLPLRLPDVWEPHCTHPADLDQPEVHCCVVSMCCAIDCGWLTLLPRSPHLGDRFTRNGKSVTRNTRVKAIRKRRTETEVSLETSSRVDG